jgi:hypothetical protein
MFVSKIPVQGVYTFGQPRVGDKDFADALNAKLGSGIYRFVNDRDIVPRVPLFHDGLLSLRRPSGPSITPARPAMPSPPWRR